MLHDAPNLAVVGAGPVGLALALHAAQQLPEARITVFDARPIERDVASDPRTLALSLGSVQLLQRLGVWPEAVAQPILQVHVSQAPPTLDWGPAEPVVHIRASEERVPMLGAVLGYGQVVAPMQAAWLALAASQPQRLAARFAPPRRLPRLEFPAGVPDDARTMVVVPTLLASVANLIVAEGAGREGVRVGLLEHLRFGLPLTLFSLALLYLGLA